MPEHDHFGHAWGTDHQVLHTGTNATVLYCTRTNRYVIQEGGKFLGDFPYEAARDVIHGIQSGLSIEQAAL